MGDNIHGRTLTTRLLDQTGRYVSITNLHAGTWEIEAEDTQAYFSVGTEETFDRTREGRYCPRDGIRSFIVDEESDARVFVYYLPAGGTAWLRCVDPNVPTKDALRNRPGTAQYFNRG